MHNIILMMKLFIIMNVTTFKLFRFFTTDFISIYSKKFYVKVFNTRECITSIKKQLF